MNRRTLKDWVMAVRPWSFPASAMPVIVTQAYLYWAYSSANLMHGVLALLGIILFHASGNVWSDYFDFKHGVDQEDTFGMKTLTSGQFTPVEIRTLALALLVPAISIGFCLVMLTGWSLLIIGICGAACSLFYPYLKYRALGDLAIFISYAVLPIFGVSYIIIGEFVPDLWLIIIPIGLITVAILHANNTRDIDTDIRASITTLAMKMGKRADMYIYTLEVVSPFAWIVGCVVLGYLPYWVLIALVGLIPAITNVRTMFRLPHEGISAIFNLDEKTAKLQLLFSFLLAVAFIL